MISRTCARLTLIVGITGLAQGGAWAQGGAVMNAAQSQFGTEPAPYATAAQQPTEARATAVNPGAYAPGGYAPGGYAPAGGYAMPQQDTASLGAPDPNKPLGRGDIVTFAIIQDREPVQQMQVTDTGELDFSAFPKIGRISVAGHTCAQVASELKHRLEADYYNTADVTMGITRVNLASSRGKIYITGNVRAPGPEDLPSTEHTTVSAAIIRAGGPDKFADMKHVKVTRNDKDGRPQSFTVDVGSIINGGHRERDVEVLDGDYINVPQRLFIY